MTGRHQTRDRLLIKLLFATGLRISEALSLTTQMIGTHEGKAVLFIKGKGNKPRLVACVHHGTLSPSWLIVLRTFSCSTGLTR
jgi:site-specific recombinase XerD